MSERVGGLSYLHPPRGNKILSLEIISGQSFSAQFSWQVEPEI